MQDLQKAFSAIKKGDLNAFEAVFRSYYHELFYYALKIVPQAEIAEELVQDLFIHIWEKRASLNINTNPKAYLYTALKNRAFNYLKSKMAKEQAALTNLENLDQTIASSEEKLNEEELIALIQKGIQSLPKKCAHIFRLSREMGMSYEEIAQELEISRETVKSQIKIAIKKLKAFLGKHWESLILIYPVWRIFFEDTEFFSPLVYPLL